MNQYFSCLRTQLWNRVANSYVICILHVISGVKEKMSCWINDYWSTAALHIEIPRLPWCVLNRELCPVNIINFIIMILRLEPLLGVVGFTIFANVELEPLNLRVLRELCFSSQLKLLWLSILTASTTRPVGNLQRQLGLQSGHV